MSKSCSRQIYALSNIMPHIDSYRTWSRQVHGQTYTISTDPRLIQYDALDAAFRSDMLYWAQPLSPELMQRCVEQSLCFGLYVVDNDGKIKGEQKDVHGNTETKGQFRTHTRISGC
jgi:hypothetical protein